MLAPPAVLVSPVTVSPQAMSGAPSSLLVGALVGGGETVGAGVAVGAEVCGEAVGAVVVGDADGWLP